MLMGVYCFYCQSCGHDTLGKLYRDIVQGEYHPYIEYRAECDCGNWIIVSCSDAEFALNFQAVERRGCDNE